MYQVRNSCSFPLLLCSVIEIISAPVWMIQLTSPSQEEEQAFHLFFSSILFHACIMALGVMGLSILPHIVFEILVNILAVQLVYAGGGADRSHVFVCSSCTLTA